ncbi:MAG: crotonase/enoyl-CoA hydratase family protein [Halioglobus sp.]|jgi:enoyl-CoA hydratase
MEYTVINNIATLTFDDGKANAVGPRFLDDVNAGLDRAQAEQVGAVILRGREGIFSGGFDLEEFKKGVELGMTMVERGFDLLVRLYSFPLPLIAACTGHCVAMGAFIVMACDSRIGSQGNFKISLPETAIGMELTPLLLALTTARISRQHMTRVALQSEVYNPEQAVEAGFIDEAVAAGLLDARTMEVALKLASLPQAQYAANKLSIRANTLRTMNDNLAEMAKR